MRVSLGGLCVMAWNANPGLAEMGRAATLKDMKKRTWQALGLLLVLSASAEAAGIPGRLVNSDPFHPVELRDETGAQVVLEDEDYDFRLSNQSKNLTVTKMETGQAWKMRVPQGWPDGNLRNFFVSGSDLGQDFDLRGVTTDKVSGSFVNDESRSCIFYDPIYCRAGCWGRQWVRVTYQNHVREFDMDFLHPGQQASKARFHGIVEQWLSRLQEIPISYCQ